MDNIIDSLISIEKKAQELSGKAKKDLDNITYIIADKNKSIAENIESKKSKDVAEMKIKTDENIESEKERIKQEKSTLLAGLTKEYENFHQQWEDDIFKNVVG